MNSRQASRIKAPLKKARARTRSRHDAPVRNTQRMPFTFCRLSEMHGPRSPRIRKQGVENAPFASVRSPRINAAPPARKAALESVIYEETVNTVLDAEFSDRILISVLVAL